MLIRERIEEQERQILSPYAALSVCAVRARAEEPCPIRTAYQRDRDRIIHSKSFRRLKRKTQVYISPGDHYRTRMTHTLEVAQIARTIARGLQLNEDLTEAIAMGHDVGHTPFGHVGEFALQELLGHFRHNEQSLRVVSVLEKNGRGLNLTREVCDGIVHHTGPVQPHTLEGKIVRLSDRIAYLCHDFDDALRAGMLTVDSLPRRVRDVLGERHSAMITCMVSDVLEQSTGRPDISQSQRIKETMDEFRDFMFHQVYQSSALEPDRQRAVYIVKALYEYYSKHPDLLQRESDGSQLITQQQIVDYIAGLTDIYAIKLFRQFYVPLIWDMEW
jgi:dGTPase